MGQGEDRYGFSMVVRFYVSLFAYFGFYGAFLMLLQRYSFELTLYLDIDSYIPTTRRCPCFNYHSTKAHTVSS